MKKNQKRLFDYDDFLSDEEIQYDDKFSLEIIIELGGYNAIKIVLY